MLLGRQSCYRYTTRASVLLAEHEEPECRQVTTAVEEEHPVEPEPDRDEAPESPHVVAVRAESHRKTSVENLAGLCLLTSDALHERHFISPAGGSRALACCLEGSHSTIELHARISGVGRNLEEVLGD